MNGNLPESARQLILASRLIGLHKSDDGRRPIAIPELFYRLAGVIAVKKIAVTAGKLLQPHQFGVGINSGAERILHSLQAELTDRNSKRAMLKLDISNAFNSCNRARVLRELYDTPQLSSLYRLADFGYSVPSALLLEGCEGQSILSANGVRQGDPLSAVLFCLYLRKLLARVAEETNCHIYGFFDDLNITGTPEQDIAALTALRRELPAISLQVNTAKSHFAYFHGEEEPLLRSVKETLADANIRTHDRWIETVGAIVGKDEDAIREGLNQMLNDDAGQEAFFYRLQLQGLSAQSAMLILRQCAVPQLNYLLRCTPPRCIREHAARFDERVLDAAYEKLAIPEEHTTETSNRILRAPLRHGGFGLTSAERTAPAAYLGSMAAVSNAPAFAANRQPESLPAGSALHSWIEDSMRTVLDHAPANSKHLPATAASFISHFHAAPAAMRHTLQRTLSSQATKHSHEASLSAARNVKNIDGGKALTHLVSISAPRAWSWKAVVPSTQDLQLTDRQYRLAARDNLGMGPGVAMPANCPNCKAHKSIQADPWHFLSCPKEFKGEVQARHDEVVNALYRIVLAVGGQALREPTGMSAEDGSRPDLRILVGGQHIITDVVVTRPMAPGYIKQLGRRRLGTARHQEGLKHRKYDCVAALHEAEMLAFSVETSGGVGPDAVRLLQILSEAGQEYLALWPFEETLKQLVGSVAIAIQRGNVLAFLNGHSRALAAAVRKEDEVRRG